MNEIKREKKASTDKSKSTNMTISLYRDRAKDKKVSKEYWFPIKIAVW